LPSLASHEILSHKNVTELIPLKLEPRDVVDDGVDDTACTYGVDNHGNDKPDNWVKHYDSNVSQDDKSKGKNSHKSEVLDQHGCERKSDVDMASKTLVKELKLLIGIKDFILSHEPLILLFIELFAFVALELLNRHSQVRNSLEAMVDEVRMGFLRVVEDAEEDGPLYLILVLGEGIDNGLVL
jgi:hypothetical protein